MTDDRRPEETPVPPAGTAGDASAAAARDAAEDTPGRGRAAIERAAAMLRTSLSAIAGIPKILTAVLWLSVLSSLALAWFWFVSRDAVWIRWLALPWLAIAAVPQFGLWFLTASVKELFRIPERLLAIKSGLADQGEYVMALAKRAEGVDRSRAGFLTKVRELYSLHGELSQVAATRLILHRFTGPIAALIGPVAFVVNCLIIAAAALQAALILP